MADFLGGEERLENPLEAVLRDSDAGIVDGHRDISVRRRRLRGRVRQVLDRVHRNREPAFAAHRIAGVDGHVDQCGLELAGVGIDEARFGRHAGDDLDRRPRQRPDHFRQRLYAFADVEHLGL